jgi:hypothetical protein
MTQQGAGRGCRRQRFPLLVRVLQDQHEEAVVDRFCARHDGRIARPIAGVYPDARDAGTAGN